MANTFIFTKSYFDAINLLDSDIKKWEVVTALCEYAFTGSDEKGKKLKGAEGIVFVMAAPVIAKTLQAYENGKKGGRPNNTIQINTSKTIQESVFERVKTNSIKDNNNNNDKDKDKDKYKDNDKDKDALSSIPLFSEIQNFIEQQQLHVVAKDFYAYYQNKNWQGVSDWKKAVLGWEENMHKWVKTKPASDDEYAVLY